MNNTRSMIGLLLVCCSCTCFAQQAEIGGRVLDQSGSLIPGASILLTCNDNGERRKALSNEEGSWLIPLLSPGRYSLVAQKESFKPLVGENIVLHVGDRIALDVVLELGTVTTRIAILSEVPMLRTADAQTGMVIDNRDIALLPQYNRDPLAFALLAPGVTGTSDTSGLNNDFRVAGSRSAAVEYYIDGQPITTGQNHDVPLAVPNMESVAEFKVVTGGLPAEYGRLSGGLITVATKSGTNQFHGSAFEYFRNNVLNANSWRGNLEAQPTGAFHDNIFGGTLGGPISIPKVYRGKDKTFFFLSFEGTKHSEANSTAFATVPTALERQGNFSQSLDPNWGVPLVIYDPLTAQLASNGSTVIRQPFPNDQIPPSRLDKMGMALVNAYPLPNHAPLPGTSSWNDYMGTAGYTFDEWKWTGKVDQYWNATNVTHFTLDKHDDSSTSGRLFDWQGASVVTNPQITAGVEHVWTISPTSILTVRMGVARLQWINDSGIANPPDTSTWGFSPTLQSLLGNHALPGIYPLDGTSSIGADQLANPIETNYSFGGDFQKLKGKHIFKMGFDHRRFYENGREAGGCCGDTYYIFTDPTSRDALGLITSGGSAIATMELGITNFGQVIAEGGPALLQKSYGLYAQDDFRVSSKLTLNLGLRWDFEPGPTDRWNRLAFWDPSYKETIQPGAGWSWSQVEQAAGVSQLPEPDWLTKGIWGRPAIVGKAPYASYKSSIPTHHDHFGPRLGFAYQFLPHTVLRGSYSLLWLPSTGNNTQGAAWQNVYWGASATSNWGGTPDNGLHYLLTLENPFPNGAGYVPAVSDITNDQFKTDMLTASWWESNSQDFDTGEEHDVTLGLQREFGPGQNSWVVELGYIGNFGRNLPDWGGVDEAAMPKVAERVGWLGTTLMKSVPNPFASTLPPGAVNGTPTVLLGNLYQENPLYHQLTLTGVPIGTSNYNGGYAQVQHRFGHGFSLSANYTYSKLLQDCDGIGANNTSFFFQAGEGPSDIYGLASNDYRHKGVIIYSWDLPVGTKRAWLGNPQSVGAKVLEKVVGGWTMAGDTTLRTGNPLNFVGGGKSFWMTLGQENNSAAERGVELSSDYNPHISGHQALLGAANWQPYLNPAAFRQSDLFPNQLEIGNMPITLPNMRAPGFSQFDFTLLKRIRLGAESRSLELRFEAQNFFNHMNAGAPDTDLSNHVSLGRIDYQAGSPRQVMVALKLRF